MHNGMTHSSACSSANLKKEVWISLLKEKEVIHGCLAQEFEFYAEGKGLTEEL